MSDEIIVNEIFTGAFQGEGRQAGQACTFVRLSRCNMHCSFCDTPYTWAYTERQAALHRDGKVYDPTVEGHRMTPERIWAKVRELRGDSPTSSSEANDGHLVVISGGEPMLQQKPLFGLFDLILGKGWRVAVETAGTIAPDSSRSFGFYGVAIQWNVSPKLKSSGNEIALRYQPKVLKEFRRWDADFKFVCSTTQDIEEVMQIQQEIEIPSSHMWLMPEGIDRESVIRNAKTIAPYAIERGWNLTLRQHILLYDNERAR